MAEEIYGLSSRDRDELRELAARSRRLQSLTNVDDRTDAIDTPYIDGNSTSAIYVARVPYGGLPALLPTFELSTYTGTGEDPIGDLEVYQQDGVECQLYRLDNTDGILIAVPSLTPKVYNLCGNSIPHNAWVLVKQDRFGNWWADGPCQGGEAGYETGTGTDDNGTGTDPDCASYKLECVNGYLVQYRCDDGHNWVYDQSTGVPCETELRTIPPVGTAPPGTPPYTYSNYFNFVSNVCPIFGHVTRVNSTYTVVWDDDIIQIDTSGVGLTLPSPTGRDPGADWFLIKNNTSGTSTISSSSGQVEGGASYNLGNRKGVIFYTDGTDWHAIAGF